MRTRELALLVLLAALTATAESQIGVPLTHADPKLESAEARELVASYCRLDYSGGRIEPSEWPGVQPMVAWRANQEFPLIMVVSRFDVSPDPVAEHSKYTVMVRYRLLGKYDISEGYSNDAANAVEDVQFVVSEVNGDLRITGIEPSYPHASRAAVLQWLDKKLKAAPDAASRVVYQQAQQALQPQKSAPSSH